MCLGVQRLERGGAQLGLVWVGENPDPLKRQTELLCQLRAAGVYRLAKAVGGGGA